jgi:hypothetical protein
MFIAAPAIIRAAVRSATRIQLTSDNRTSGQREFTSTSRALPVKLTGDEGKRCVAYRWLFAPRFPKRALSRRRRAVRELVTHRLAPIATLHFRLTKGPLRNEGQPNNCIPFCRPRARITYAMACLQRLSWKGNFRVTGCHKPLTVTAQ